MLDVKAEVAKFFFHVALVMRICCNLYRAAVSRLTQIVNGESRRLAKTSCPAHEVTAARHRYTAVYMISRY